MSDRFNPADLARQVAASVPVFALIEGWQTVTQSPTPGFSRTEAALQAAERIVGAKMLAPVRSAVAGKDPRALAALEIFSVALKPFAAMTRADCLGLRSQGRFQDLLTGSELLRLYADAADEDEMVMDALWLHANALRGLQDARGAIAAYRNILAVAAPDDMKRRSAALDNLANILMEVGDYDEALTCFEASDKAAASPHERYSILLNRARLRLQLGEIGNAQADMDAAKLFLKQAGGTPAEWGMLYDFAADLCRSEGRYAEALARTVEAQAVFKDGPLKDLAINAMNRAVSHKALDQMTAAAAAFDEAFALAEQVEASGINEEFYRAGFIASLKQRLAFADKLYRLMESALASASQGRPQQALQLFAAAAKRAREGGDILAALRMQMNEVAQLQGMGQVAKAGAIADQVRREAQHYGLAYPEAGVTVTLSSLRDDGSDRATDSLFGYVRAKLLLSTHQRILGGLKLDARTMAYETADGGVLDNQLSKLAERGGAFERAAAFARVAADKAIKTAPFDGITSNRLAGLLDLYRKLGRTEEADAVTERLRSLLADKRLTTRARLLAARAMGNDTLNSAPAPAEGFFKTAIDASEEIRGSIANAADRALADRQYREIYRKYAMLLRKAGKPAAAYEALQFGRGRIFKDAVSDDHRPATLAEIQQALPAGETLVEFAAEEAGLAAYVVTANSLDVVTAQGDLEPLQAADFGDLRQRAAKLLQICRQSALLLTLVAAVARHVHAGGRVLLVADIGLHNLPLHVTPIDGLAWCERATIGYLPSAAFLLTPAGANGGTVFVAGNSRGDLPGADAECDEVAALYDVLPLKRVECTRSALEAALEKGPVETVHLAVHGRGNPRRGSQSSLMFAAPGGGTELVDLETLAARPWPARLVVLSGCSTGLGGLRDGRELVSVAGQILQSGAQAVVASLWPVGDENARLVMRAFHTALRDSSPGMKDVRRALDVARAKLAAGNTSAAGKVRDGRDISPENMQSDADGTPVSTDLDWASFVVVGNPLG